MNNFSAHPWYICENDLLRNCGGQPIAQLLKDPDTRRGPATERLLSAAPGLLISLRFAIGILSRAGDHPELRRHLQRVVDRVEPEGVAKRLENNVRKLQAVRSLTECQ
jgi:hypothetical protein